MRVSVSLWASPTKQKKLFCYYHIIIMLLLCYYNVI